MIERTLRKGKRPTDYNPEKAGLKKIEELKDLGGNWAELELKLNYLKKSQDSLNLTKGFSDYGNMNPRRYEYYSKKIEYYKHVLESFIYNVHLTHSPKDLRIILKARKAKLDNTPSSAPRSPILTSSCKRPYLSGG